MRKSEDEAIVRIKVTGIYYDIGYSMQTSLARKSSFLNLITAGSRDIEVRYDCREAW